MTYRMCFLTLLISLFLCQSEQAGANKDKRLVPISASQLREAISQTPLESPLQQELLLRARHAHLLGVAYTRYTALWQRQPDNAYANLLRGVSAEYLQTDSMEPELRKLYEADTHNDLFPVAASCLEKAVKLAPSSSVINMETGFFLWQFGNDLPQGLTYLRKALRLAPNDPRVHAMWGNVYANPEGTDYNLRKAIDQLELAIKLDPTYAFPHRLMADVYSRLKQPVKAEQERSIYRTLSS